MTKLSSLMRTAFLTAFLAVFAAGCDGDQAQLWHYWIAPIMMISAVFVVLVVMPLGYYFKVYRLKQRGR